jgi:ATP-dependent DNA helicase PIF1
MSMTLTKEQLRVIELLDAGHNVFCTGYAGTGKSFLLAEVLARRSEYNTHGHTVVTASSGLAALNIDGQTIHRFSGVGTAEGPVQYVVDMACRNERVKERWCECNLLIIDEISMLSGDTLHKIDCTARACRKRPSDPFGGVQLLLLGDFAQLPPITRHREVYDFCFLSPCWLSLRLATVLLSRVFRQDDDSQFADILGEMRFGRLTARSCTVLCERVLTSPEPVAGNPSVAIVPTKICARNEDVDRENTMCLKKLSGTSQVYTSRDSGEDAGALRSLQSTCPAAACIELKKGAHIIFLKNIDPDAGIVNGTRGIVTGFVHHTSETRPTKGTNLLLPQIQFSDRASVWIVEPYAWDIRRTPTSAERALLNADDVTNEERTRILEGLVVARRIQLPIRLAWALSVHKCQGMTLDAIELSMRHIFEYGQAYVAFSRARRLASVHLCDFFPGKIKAHPQVCAFYDAITRGVDPVFPVVTKTPCSQRSVHTQTRRKRSPSTHTDQGIE